MKHLSTHVDTAGDRADEMLPLIVSKTALRHIPIPWEFIGKLPFETLGATLGLSVDHARLGPCVVHLRQW